MTLTGKQSRASSKKRLEHRKPLSKKQKLHQRFIGVRIPGDEYDLQDKQREKEHWNEKKKEKKKSKQKQKIETLAEETNRENQIGSAMMKFVNICLEIDQNKEEG